MTISAEMVKNLRRQSGAGIMECKDALKENDGDVDAALDFLRKKGTAKAAKKADRSTKEGAISGIENGKTAVMVEIKCETDFVARNENFQKLCGQIADHLLNSEFTDDDEAFSNQAFSSDSSKTVNDILTENIHELGENLVIGRRVRFDMSGPGKFSIYIHGVGSIGSLVELGCESENTADSDKFKELAKDISMHIAAANPISITKDDVPKGTLSKEKEIFEAQAKESGKPDNIIPKIVEGRVKKFFKEACLLEQAFVKDTEITVGALLNNIGKELGETVTVRRFCRLQLGE